ncbi:MAG: ORF6N domain-containing protein [Kiritimatiellia bacterium]|nr:ORF6N domain-containing protein [Kiritimatiellia bacterium]
MSNKLTVHSPQDFIRRVRGQAVILDADLAALYGVPIKRLNEQVRRNRDRFPEDFVFQLTGSEWDSLRSHFATLKRGQHRKYYPYAFTEHGAIMAANVLNSEQAVQMSVAVVRAFIKLRRMALSVEALARKVNELEKKYDERFRFVFDAIRKLMNPPEPSRRRIGFSKDAK